jgi:hypothetical protein
MKYSIDLKIGRLNYWLVGFGLLFLLYAFLGNYVALPGYIRFLERGGTSEAGNAFDIDVLIGAIKTIFWMYSFQLGVLLLACAYSNREDLYTRYIVIFGLVWLILWSWPSIPMPSAWFYIVFGTALLVMISLVLLGRGVVESSKLPRSLFLGSILFFSFATWEVCGLGTTGRMLHPEQSTSGLSNTILVTQSTKLMIEFVLAWALLLASLVLGKKQ